MGKDLNDIFDKLKSLLSKYSPPLTVKTENVNGKPSYHLWSVKNLKIAKRKRKEVYFAGIITQKDYVGFYYMPVYTNKEFTQFFKPEFLKLLKGMSCFYIKKLDDELLRQIETALEKGFQLYKERGWV